MYKKNNFNNPSEGGNYHNNVMGFYYQKINDIDNMLKYYKMTIDKGNDDGENRVKYNAMSNMVKYYHSINDNDNVLKYYNMLKYD